MTSTDTILQLIGAGRLQEAEEKCLHGQKQTGDAEYIYLLAIIRAQQKRFDDAIVLFEEATQQLPDRADIAYNFGVICQSANDLERAVTAWQRAAEIDPLYEDALYNAALGLGQLGREKDSERAYEQLLKINSEHTMALYNLANLKVRHNEAASALPLFQRLLNTKPDFEAGWVNFGLATQRAGDFENAQLCFTKALALNPQSVDAHWNLAHLLLIQGRWREGFREYEWRLKRPEAPQPDWPQPAWDGTPAPEKTLLLWIDQGVGDAIQFFRYARMVSDRVNSVVLRCQESLMRLAETVPGIHHVISIGDPLPSFDMHAPLMSLAHVLDESEPADTWQGPYVSIQQEFDLDAPQTSRRIGFVWAGNPAHRNDANRSCSLTTLQPLLAIPNMAFFSLQVGAGRDALSIAPGFENLIDLAPRLKDFADTAAAIEALDLVISVDTAVAHLAGALNKPTWLMVPAIDTDWRWLREGTDSAWYPSLRLFRQTTPGDWAGVVTSMETALQKL